MGTSEVCEPVASRSSLLDQPSAVHENPLLCTKTRFVTLSEFVSSNMPKLQALIPIPIVFRPSFL
jgi:hypothetical protein